MKPLRGLLAVALKACASVALPMLALAGCASMAPADLSVPPTRPLDSPAPTAAPQSLAPPTPAVGADSPALSAVLPGSAKPPVPNREGVVLPEADLPVRSLAGEYPAAAPRPNEAASVPAARPDAQTDTVDAPLPPAIPIDPLSPDRTIDPQDPTAHSDLWLRIRIGFAMPTLDNALVRKWERYYAERPDYVQRMIDRGSRYLYHVVEEVEKRGMPTELALLPFVESAFNPQAQSVARASGMWQFIPSTGRLYQLRQNAFRDDRRDVLASTRAALDFLQSLHQRFGDWQLALAAYNWGPGSVARAITANQRARKPTDYEHLRMPNETRNYLPKLQAVRNIIGSPQDHGLDLPPLDNHPYFLSVPITRDIDIDLAARLAEVPLEEFQHLNPQLNRPLILAAGTDRVLLPYDNANAFARNLAGYRGRLSSWAVWVAPKTAKSAEVARQIGISESQLREVNQIPPNMLVRAGSTLVVPRAHDKQGDVASHIAQNGVLNLSPEFPPPRRTKIRAGNGGTTVAEVAQKYRMSVQQVARLNRVAEDASFKAGQVIVVMMPGKNSAAHTSAKPVRRGSAKAAPGRRVAQSQR